MKKAENALAKQFKRRMLERVNSLVSEQIPTENEIDRVETPPPDAGFMNLEEEKEEASLDFLIKKSNKKDDLIIIDQSMIGESKQIGQKTKSSLIANIFKNSKLTKNEANSRNQINQYDDTKD